MAIAFNAATESFTNAGQTLNFSHTTAGTDRILWVGVMTLSTRSVSGVTYNGVAMTGLTRSGGGQPVQLWYLINPATGSNTVSISIGSPNSFIYAAAASYTGAKQSGQPDSQNTNNVSGSPINTSTTVVAANSWAILVARNDTSGDTTASTGSTERAAGAIGTVQLYDSNGGLSAGSQTMSLTSGGGGTTTAIASFSEAVAASTFRPRIIMY